MRYLLVFFNARGWSSLLPILRIKVVFLTLTHWFLVSSRRQEAHSGRKHFYTIFYSHERILNIKPRCFILFTTLRHFLMLRSLSMKIIIPAKKNTGEFQVSNCCRKSLYFLQNTESLLSLFLLIVTAPLAGWVNLKEMLQEENFWREKTLLDRGEGRGRRVQSVGKWSHIRSSRWRS